MLAITARSQSALLSRIRLAVRDPQGVSQRWSDSEIYYAINLALDNWGRKVMLPFIEDIANFASATNVYTLPWYVSEPVDPQYKLSADVIGGNNWIDFPSYGITSDGAGVLQLQLPFYPPSASGRIIWWKPNSILPTTIPSKDASAMAADADSVTLSSVVEISNAGFIKIESEWMSYSNRDVGTATTTLNGLVRGLFGTTAAAHNSAVSVEFGVAVHRQDLYTILDYQVISTLHSLFMTNPSNTETGGHEFNLRYYADQIEKYWARTYRPLRTPKLIQTAQGIGMNHISNTLYGQLYYQGNP